MIENLKLLLDIPPSDHSNDEKLSLILDSVVSRLSLLLGGIEPPDSMDHIVLDVAAARFNRIGSEGFSSHSVEGESISFSNRDFDCCMDEITAFMETQSCSDRGKVKFL